MRFAAIFVSLSNQPRQTDNYSDLDELFGENCKFRFLVMNQNAISKKPKAKKVSYINYNFYSFT